LRINPKKCTFFKQKLVYLGHVISGEGIQTDPEKVPATNGLKTPTNLKELRQWIGMASWYRRFVPSFATIVQLVTSEERSEVDLGTGTANRLGRD